MIGTVRTLAAAVVKNQVIDFVVCIEGYIPPRHRDILSKCGGIVVFDEIDPNNRVNRRRIKGFRQNVTADAESDIFEGGIDVKTATAGFEGYPVRRLDCCGIVHLIDESRRGKAEVGVAALVRADSLLVGVEV